MDASRTVDGTSEAALEHALDCLLRGGVVAIPTDTLYGLAADVLNESALERVFDIKGRPANMALPVLVASWEQVGMVAVVPDKRLQQLASAFWPGSLTLVLTKRSGLSPLVTGGRDTVAVRMPDHWVPRTLAARLGRPITGTSANLSGQSDIKSIQELRELLGAGVDAVFDGKPDPSGTQSTIVDLTGASPALLREGATSFSRVLLAWDAIVEGRSLIGEQGV